jgi:hypothetical protein
LLDDGAVEVSWAETDERPFAMRAVYRWRDASTVDLETSVTAVSDLRGFESFVACYFHERFTNAMVAAKPVPARTAAGADATPGAGGAVPASTNGPVLVRVTRAEGEWQMFPRDAGVIPLIEDGRWKLEPHPVNWTIRSELMRPLVRRRAPSSGLSALLMAPAEECFAVALPYETEGHYSVYASLFGRDLRAGETARARVRLAIAVAKPDAAVYALYDEARKEWGAGSDPAGRPAAGDGQ